MTTFKNQIAPQWRRRLNRRIRIDDREILVFDGLFSREVQRRLYEFARSEPFRWNATDSSDPKFAHSVRWKLDIARGATRSTEFFSTVDSLVKDVTSASPLRVYDIYVNFNLYGEVHYPHIDGLGCITALYCANAQWNVLWQGETCFFENSEPAYVIVPKPGRLTVFDGGISHRGSPPARDCWEPRLNIVFKFAKSKEASKRIAYRRQRQMTPWHPTPIQRVC
jgi:hypothetical protein